MPVMLASAIGHISIQSVPNYAALNERDGTPDIDIGLDPSHGGSLVCGG
jgi:hypothetical protein